MFKNNGTKLKIIFLATIAVIILLFCTGCAGRVETIGFDPRSVDFAKIKIGESSKTSIEDMIGPPNLVSEDRMSYYYIREDVSRIPQLPAMMKDFYGIAFHFDANGVLVEYKEYDRSTMGSLRFYKGETDAPIKDISFFRQFGGRPGKHKNAEEEQI